MTTNIQPINKELFNRDSWSTPQYLFDWLNSIYKFDIDLCADSENKKCDYWYGVEDDALTFRWNHLNTGFCNPPYSSIKPWVKKAIEEVSNGFTTVMLIPTPNGESYYKDVFDHAKSITFITGRIAFYNPHLKKLVGGNTRGSCVVEFSKTFKYSKPEIYHILRDDLIARYSK